MANTEEIELNCILYGSNPAKFFRVDAPIIRGDASGLKSLVCEAARVRLGMVIEPQHLTLWKVSVLHKPFPTLHLTTFFSPINRLLSNLSRVWPNV